MKESLYAYLSDNEYPGRGICIGRTPGGKRILIAYFIMGRSINSRNRIFSPIAGGIRTVAADPSQMTDPHLIIYNPVLTYGGTTIVTNGDQTDTIRDFIARNHSPGFCFEAALETRTFEDDGPNWTPRISGIADMRLGGYKLNILKSNDGDEKSLQRSTFAYPQPVAGEGHFISTYKCNGTPIPSFTGEPLRVAVDEEDPDEYAGRLWDALNENNKVSLFVRSIDLATQNYADVIINKYKTVEG
ncbi:MAG TPA: IMP cyclohydrolase [Smithellaceae bacterium]|nr:IMP cyclohydrolase [Smithellaceae bacterium]